jgi:hypothetical protein
MNALKLEDDGSVDREVKLARVETLRAALSATAEPAAAGDVGNAAAPVRNTAASARRVGPLANGDGSR